MDNNRAPVKEITDYLDWLKTYHPNEKRPLFFRGDRKKSKLLPGIAREIETAHDLKVKEKKMLEEIKRWKYHPGFFSQNFSTESDLELLVYAQHYGMKTRLLDWTPNPLTALFFALDSFRNDLEGFRPDLELCNQGEDRKKDEDQKKEEYKKKVLTNPPVVYMLIPYEYKTVYCHDQKDIENHENWNEIRETIAYIPHYNNSRIMAQDGVFTFHAFSNWGFVPLNEMAINDAPGELFIADIEVEKDNKVYIYNLLEHLDILGINQQTIYPDFENFCKHINWKWIK